MVGGSAVELPVEFKSVADVCEVGVQSVVVSAEATSVITAIKIKTKTKQAVFEISWFCTILV